MCGKPTHFSLFLAIFRGVFKQEKYTNRLVITWELVGKPEGKRPLGRPRRICEDNIKMNLQEVGEGGRGDWMELAQDRDR
jgi:hypothetical protein